MILLNRIMELCAAHDISINALESMAGLSRNSVSKWGKSIPSGDRILKVAQFFDVSMDYLMGNTDNPSSHKQGPHYNTIGTVIDLRQIKNEIETQAAAFAESLSALVDEKIAKANETGQISISDNNKK